MQMLQFEDAIAWYRRAHDGLPRSLEALTLPPEPILARIPKDPWDRDYRYRVLGDERYEIRSLGEDEEDGDDDLLCPEPE